MTEYKKHLSEPWFSLIQFGLKKCEGRLNKGDFSQMKKGDTIIFENNDFGFIREYRVKVTSVHYYQSFDQYLNTETLEKCLPGIDTIEKGVSIYRKYYSKEDEDKIKDKYKIIAIRVKVVK